MRLTRGLIGPLLACLAAGLLVRHFVDVVEVRGRSMLPTLRPGDRLLVVRGLRPPRVGEVVLARDPRTAGRELVKRVARIDTDGVTLHGDNATFSTDARTFGTLPPGAVRWRVAWRYWPFERAGALGPGPSPPPAATDGFRRGCRS